MPYYLVVWKRSTEEGGCKIQMGDAAETNNETGGKQKGKIDKIR